MIRHLALVAMTLVGGFVVADTATAQATRTWISGIGDDANPCSRTAPCKSFAGAISKTAPGGSVECLDPVIIGTVTVDCGKTDGKVFEAWILAAPELEARGSQLGYIVMASPAASGATTVVYIKEGRSDEGYGLLGKKWDQRETINVSYQLTSDGFRPAIVKRLIEQKPPIGPWRLVEEKTDAPAELLAAVPSAKN